MGLAARIAASTPIVQPVQPTSTPALAAAPVAAQPQASSSSGGPMPASDAPPNYAQSTDPFGDGNRAAEQAASADQKVAYSSQVPSQDPYASSSSQPQRQNSVVSTAPSSGNDSVKRKSSIFRNPFRRNSTQTTSNAPSSSSFSSQQRQPSFAPPSGPPPGRTLTGTPRVNPVQVNKEGEFRLTVQQIEDILTYCVEDQGIQAFYDQRALHRIAARLADTSALNQLAVAWNLPREFAADLVKLALFDTVLLLDDSGSMAFEEGGSRIDDMKLILERVALAASLFDDDGIQVRFLNSKVEGDGIRDSQGVIDLVSRVKFQGLTPLGTAMEEKILSPLIVKPAQKGRLAKPVLVIAVTDGTPQGEPREKILRVIMQANKDLSRTRYGADALSISFAQVGNDTRAQAFLGEIDNHPVVGGLVDATSNYELEADEMLRTSGVELSPSMWIMKVLMGGISTEYDEADE